MVAFDKRFDTIAAAIEQGILPSMYFPTAVRKRIKQVVAPGDQTATLLNHHLFATAKPKKKRCTTRTAGFPCVPSLTRSGPLHPQMSRRTWSLDHTAPKVEQMSANISMTVERYYGRCAVFRACVLPNLLLHLIRLFILACMQSMGERAVPSLARSGAMRWSKTRMAIRQLNPWFTSASLVAHVKSAWERSEPSARGV